MASTAKRKASEVWHFFSVTTTVRLAKCNLCETEVPRVKIGAPERSYSTKGLWDHLRVKHNKECKEAENKRDATAQKKRKLDEEAAKNKEMYKLKEQLTLKEAFEAGQRWPKNSDKQRDTQTLMINWMIDTQQPYSVVENSQFRNFISGQFSRYLSLNS